MSEEYGRSGREWKLQVSGDQVAVGLYVFREKLEDQGKVLCLKRSACFQRTIRLKYPLT